jgi:hypothetical protein
MMLRLFGSKKHPKGPNWSKAETHCLELSGTRVCFTTPPNNDRDFPFEAQPDKYNIYDDALFSPVEGSDEPARTMDGGFQKNWEFRTLLGGRDSPIFDTIGWVRFLVLVVKDESFGSLLEPQSFLKAVNQRINYQAGPRSGHWKEKFLHVRKNWRIQYLDDVAFAHYAHHERAADGFVNVSQFWQAPLTDKHYIDLSFDRFIYAKNTRLDAVYDDLIARVMSSVRIEWSADARRQQAEAQAQWPDQALPESLPELTWSDEEWRAHESDHDREMRETAEAFEALCAAQGQLEA